MRKIIALIILASSLYASTTSYVCMMGSKEYKKYFTLDKTWYGKPTTLAQYSNSKKLQAIYENTQTKTQWIKDKNIRFMMSTDNITGYIALTKDAPYKMTMLFYKGEALLSEFEAICIESNFN